MARKGGVRAPGGGWGSGRKNEEETGGRRPGGPTPAPAPPPAFLTARQGARGKHPARRYSRRECDGQQKNREKIAEDERLRDLARADLRTSDHHNQFGSTPSDDG